ncbi:MAG TPA: polysaccharide pyruvyl transferase family protein, partial [Jatrophihabitans sp.]|nr:polysaccharide pyruvyl transferase family protein [Jatrophihabitans sp.]
DIAEESMTVVDGDEGAEDVQRPGPPDRLPRRRAREMTHIVMAGQRGEAAEVQQLAERLAGTGTLTAQERNATRVAGSFAAYASAGDGSDSLSLAWWPRPFPGNFGDWLSPFLLQRLTGRRVLFQPPAAVTEAPHLVMIGSIGRFVQSGSVVVGTGVSEAATRVNPAAHFVSLRGPLTAAAVRNAGGPQVESFGDPGLLLARLLPITRAATNGRLALVRHHAHAELPVTVPEGMDEHSVLASGPDEIIKLVSTLSEYDGVVTSAMHVMIACHSYGIPCAPVTFNGYVSAVPGGAMPYRDYSLGADLDEVWTPEPVELDLRTIDWRSRLRSCVVAGAKLDEIEAAVLRGVKEYDVAAEEYEDDHDEDDDDGDV